MIINYGTNHRCYSIEATPETIIEALKEANANCISKWERYITLWTKATSAKSIRYDKDPVQSSHDYSMVDVICNIDEAEEAYYAAVECKKALTNAFVTFMRAAGLDEETRTIWMYRYAKLYSIRDIAKELGVSKGSIQYHLGEAFEKKYFAHNN